MLTITHTHAEGTLIQGTQKGDGTADVLSKCGWRWGRSIGARGAWYVPQSRDRLPKAHVIKRTVGALQDAGFEVETEISRETRSTAEVEAEMIARQADRVAALQSKADRSQAAADSAWAAHERDVARLPEGGEPIKVGHHSEGRHRAAIARADRSVRRAIDTTNDAEEAIHRAEAASHTTTARYSAQTVANRIERLAADIRRIERQTVAPTYDEKHGGYRPATDEEKTKRAARIAPRLEEIRDQLDYWKDVRAEQIAAGKATDYSREDIKPGDAVLIRGHWRRVVRANAKTVSVETDYPWTDKTPYSEIRAHRTAREIDSPGPRHPPTATIQSQGAPLDA